MSRVFEAAYPGTCEACGEEIEEGDRVRYTDDDELRVGLLIFLQLCYNEEHDTHTFARLDHRPR